jgi:hypothetical protein
MQNNSDKLHAYVEVVTIFWLYSCISVEIDRDRCWLVVRQILVLYVVSTSVIYKDTDAALERPAILPYQSFLLYVFMVSEPMAQDPISMASPSGFSSSVTSKVHGSETKLINPTLNFVASFRKSRSSTRLQLRTSTS